VLYGTDLVLNVAFGSDQKKIDYGRIKSILNDLGLTHLIASEEDYQVKSLINSDGSNISGGERQRIAIARALYKNAKLLIFDEATSALDEETEAIIQESIEQINHHNVAIIIVAHQSKIINICNIKYRIQNNQLIKEE
jgi:ABC-type multidrug transport system fused ATPase/permease subunit